MMQQVEEDMMDQWIARRLDLGEVWLACIE